ncbi:hypothetical protein [Kribbella deserti]|uniref:Uncharacterized protein n=1 Tax=Kribbella deserti TaxID=1926257 RepID=A0ABV6QHQ4_9ACTN
MNLEPHDLLTEASTPADLAVILIAGSLGYVLDAGLLTVGFMSSGAFGIVSATTALGIKKAADAAVQRARLRRSERTVRERAEVAGQAISALTAAHALT